MYSRLYNVLSSARLAVTLFFTLAATSVIGTLLEQGLPLERYEELFGQQVFSVLAFFNLFDMYHSWWFTLLLVLFSLNILACTLRQMPRMIRHLFPGKTDIDDAVFKTSQFRKTWLSRDAMPDLEQRSVSLMKSLAGAPVLMTKDNVRYLFSESGRYSRSGMFLVHISILFILGGALIGALWGFNGQMNIAEGSKSDTVRLFNSKVSDKTLDFDVVCNDFNVDFYKTGMPREYKTDLTIMEDGKDVLTGSITVNHPIVYRGMKLCQSTYGIADARNFSVAVRDGNTGNESVMTLDRMKKTPIPESASSFAVARFISEHEEGGPAALGVFFEPGKEHEMFWLFKDQETPRGNFSFTLNGFDIVYYTGIQVSYDPGTPLVWIGFVLLISGLVLSLMVNHKRVWMRIKAGKDGHEILLAADVSKNRDSFNQKLDESFLMFQKGRPG